MPDRTTRQAYIVLLGETGGPLRFSGTRRLHTFASRAALAESGRWPEIWQ